VSEGSYEFLEHTSDAYVLARGRSLEEAFAAAALAMSDILTDPTKVRPKVRISVEVSAEDLEALLYRWLERLLVLFEVEGLVFVRHSLKIVGHDGGYLLRANVEGERFDPAIHPAEVAIKAVTYHDMKIVRGDDTADVWVLFDI
jgi:SHS2 domain-containing protein